MSQKREKEIIDLVVSWFWYLKPTEMKPEDHIKKYCDLIPRPTDSSDENTYNEVAMSSEDVLLCNVARYIHWRNNTIDSKPSTGFGDYLIELGEKLNNPNSTVEQLVKAADVIGLNLVFKMTSDGPA